MIEIAKGQLQSDLNSQLLDTDLITIKIWSNYKYGNCDNWILEQIEEQKSEERFYHLGSEPETFTTWHNNGQKKSEGTYKDGEQDGKYTEWRENGKKYYERTYKDDKKDGLETAWHENGKKYYERT